MDRSIRLKSFILHALLPALGLQARGKARQSRRTLRHTGCIRADNARMVLLKNSTMPLKTLFLNPPSFENFDGGAGSRWPATREIESFWYPVWLAYPTGMLEGARLLDAPSHHVSAQETIDIARDYEFLVLFTSTPGFPGDIRVRH